MFVFLVRDLGIPKHAHSFRTRLDLTPSSMMYLYLTNVINYPNITISRRISEMETSFFVMMFVLLRAEPIMAAVPCGNCGKTPVPFPLSTGPKCGDQAYKIRCTAGTLWFDALYNSSYAITSVNPQAQTMTVLPAPTMPKTCTSSDLRSQGIQLDQNLPFNITASNTILLLNCTDNMLHLQVPINCSSTCVCHAYIDSTRGLAPCKKPKLCCIFRTGGSQNEYMIRVHSQGCMAYQSFVNLNPALPLDKWPQPGLELMWDTPIEPACKTELDCRELPFSLCVPDPVNAGQKRCFCKAGRYWDATTGYCQSKYSDPCLLISANTPCHSL